MKITLLGTGDSAGIPQIGCGCSTCRRHSEEGRHRTRFSILVENDGERVLVDASPDLRFQFLREEVPGVDDIVFTHAHYDHYAGLGSLYRITWDDLPVYGAEEVLTYILDERYGYLPFPEPVDVEPFEGFGVAGLDLELVPVHHPPVDSYGVVVEDGDHKVVITGDTSTHVPEATFKRMESPDLLIADAFIPADGDYSSFVRERISDDGEDFADKHMTYEGALRFADGVGADETVLVHLSHYFREEHDELGRDGDVFAFE